MSTINLQALQPYREMMGDAFVIDIIETFLSNSQTLIDEITQSLVTRNVGVFTRAAHTLKSNSTMLGAQILSEHCLKLELAGRSGQIDGMQDDIASLNEEYQRVCAELRQVLAQ